MLGGIALVVTMLLKLTTPLLLVIISTGCSTHMLQHGLAIHTTPVGASQMAGYTDPIASKTTNGDIVFEYDVRVEQYGMMGYWHGPHKVLGRERLTNVVSAASLRPATNFWRLGIATADCPAATMEFDIAAASQRLPLLDRQASGQGRWAFPRRECVLWVGEWVWYVPPRRDGDMPLASVLSQETTRTPGYAHPARILLFPVVLVGDILYWPTVWVLSGGHPTI